MLRKHFLILIFFTILMIFNSATVFGQPGTPDIVTGAKQLAEDALKWILIIIPVTAGVMIAWHSWMKSLADGDPGVIETRNKRIKNVLVASIIGECAAGIVQVVMSYF